MFEIKQKQLEGLTYRTSKRRELVVDGKKKVVMEPIERPLQVRDILSATDYGSTVRIVTADGRKYDVPVAKQEQNGKGKQKDNNGAPDGAGTGAAGPDGTGSEGA